MTINQDDRDFLESHKVYFEQARMKFLHGFSHWVMDRFNSIFVKYVQPGYVLTPWCSECVIDMVTKLGAWYDGIRDEEMLSIQAGAANVAAQFAFPDDLDFVPITIDDEKKEFSFKAGDVAKAMGLEFTLPMGDPETIPVQRGETIVDAPIKKKAGRPKKKK